MIFGRELVVLLTKHKNSGPLLDMVRPGALRPEAGTNTHHLQLAQHNFPTHTNLNHRDAATNRTAKKQLGTNIAEPKGTLQETQGEEDDQPDILSHNAHQKTRKLAEDNREVPCHQKSGKGKHQRKAQGHRTDPDPDAGDGERALTRPYTHNHGISSLFIT